MRDESGLDYLEIHDFSHLWEIRGIPGISKESKLKKKIP